MGLVCACLPAINLMLEKRNAARVSQNRPRTRFLSSIVAWKSSLGSSVLKSTHVTHNHREDVYTTGVGRSPWHVDEEVGLQEIPTGRRASTTGKDADIEVNQLLVGPCIRLNSKDGRDEGWLRRESGGTGVHAGPSTSEPTTSAGGVTLQQLRQDPREILVPDRIWDGKRRSHEETSPSDTPLSSRHTLVARAISSPLSSGGSSNTLQNVASPSAAGPSS